MEVVAAAKTGNPTPDGSAIHVRLQLQNISLGTIWEQFLKSKSLID
jgi:hypothetical protein